MHLALATSATDEALRRNVQYLTLQTTHSVSALPRAPTPRNLHWHPSRWP
jgi:hypothetical protein